MLSTFFRGCAPTSRLGSVRQVLADLIGKGKHIRTVPMPGWVKRAVDDWTQAAGITTGFIFRAVSRSGAVWGDHSCARLCHLAGGELEQIQFLLGHVSVQTTERYLGCKQK